MEMMTVVMVQMRAMSMPAQNHHSDVRTVNGNVLEFLTPASILPVYVTINQIVQTVLMKERTVTYLNVSTKEECVVTVASKHLL